MAVASYPTYNHAYGDGFVLWDGTDASSFNYLYGPRQGREMAGSEAMAAWLCIDPVDEDKNYAPSDAFLVLMGRTRNKSGPDDIDNDAIDIYIHGVDEDDHASPTNTASWDTDHGLATTAGVWDKEHKSVLSQVWVSRDVAPICTEIMARDGKASGQAMGLHLDGDAGQVPGFDDYYIEYAYGTAANRPRLIMMDAGEVWARPIGLIPQTAVSGEWTASTGWDYSPFRLPPDSRVGELLLCIGVVADSADVTWPDGWHALTETDNSTVVTLVAAWHKVDGSEGKYAAVTLDAEEEGGVFFCMRIINAADPDVTPPEIAVATGNDANPDPPSISPAAGSKKYMVLAVEGCDYSRNVTAYPYDKIAAYTTETAYCGLGFCVEWVESDTINPGAYTIAAADEWVAATIIIHPAATPGTYYNATQGGAWGAA